MADDSALVVLSLVTFIAGASSALLLAIAGYTFASRRRRKKDGVQQLPASQEKGGTADDTLCDPERGQCDKDDRSDEGAGGPDMPVPLTTQQLFETLRDRLGDEISKGLACSELIERLDRLEKDAEFPGEGLRGAALASVGDVEAKSALKVTLKSSQKSSETQSPNSSDRSGGSSMLEEDSMELPGMIPAAGLVTRTPSPLQPNEVTLPPSMPPSSVDESRSDLELGPTSRQRRRKAPPEKISQSIDEETALQTSLTTVQKILGKRDAQTTELHKQLREARQHLWFHTEEARVANARLHEILADPSRAPQAQAEALGCLKKQVKELSTCLANSRAEEQYWATIAKRQRAFFVQNERLSREPGEILRKHPAGDIFLAPPPVVVHDDEQPNQQPSWDIATSHCNPYCVDSWPFEPNVLAQRASQEPNLDCLEEGEDEYVDDDDEEDMEDDVEDDDQDSQEEGEGMAKTARSL